MLKNDMEKQGLAKKGNESGGEKYYGKTGCGIDRW